MSDGADGPRIHLNRSQARWSLPAGSREILLVRHGSSVGRTIETLELGAVVASNPALSADGVVQAAALAKHLAGEPIRAVFVTPLQRTHQTAAPLAAALGLDTVELPELSEIHLGDWEHTFHDHAEAGHPFLKQMMVEESWEVLPNAERHADFAARVRAGIDAIVAATAPDTVTVSVSHAGVIAELCRQATGSRPFAFMAPENTSVSRLVVSESGRWRLRSFNDVSHLVIAAREKAQA